MSVWRRKAIECMPENRAELQNPGSSIYEAFFELLPAIRTAHRQKDTAKLKSCYAFAEWCFSQREKDLWNAAGVAFYEHLADNEETLKEMPKWVKRSIYIQIRDLLVLRVGEDLVKQIDKLYQTF
ncbi:DUF7674 family protein [Chitinophaga pinensis]|uniref:DUF7674 domain-containing protein n=1 Tax=Chitinophaga pinensis (strain ATCC 43595 / DSM 2588 / LMG 13176 / NBRC 15968 / NCIMB 11800 / UQM 2034) TaxID=485918 RepID=A0A979G8F8_CHIPD|nr:hypothetical protein [Chitinophaga pinensis]ACU62607.1 hypothetical protein Cpin_5176 [Chitinophaga pinensis DSM 2588]